MYSLRGPTELGLVAHRRAQDVAGRVVGQPQVFLQPLALGALAAARRAEKYEVQLGHRRMSI